MDRDKLRKKVLLNLLSAPATVLPAVAGVSALVVGWATDSLAGWPGFLGVVGILAGLGTLVTRWIYGAEHLARQAADSLEAEAQAEEEKRLDALYRRMRRDRDTRDERSLRELRKLYQAFRDDKTWRERVSQQSAVEISAKVEKLYRGCIASLERCLEISEAARQMATQEARAGLLENRESLLAEVRSSIDHLAQTMDGVKAMAVAQPTDAELSRIRRELDESLDVARRVEERMQSLESELGRRPDELMRE